MQTEYPIALIYKHLFSTNKVESQAEFGDKLGYKPSFTSKLISGTAKQPADLGKKLSEVYKLTEDAIKRLEKAAAGQAVEIEKPASKDTGIDHMRMLIETHAALMANQTTINKTAEAAIEAARSASEIAKSVSTRFAILEERIEDDTTMIRAIQEVLVVHVGERLPNTSPQEMNALVGSVVIRLAAEEKKRKKGTRSAAGMKSS